MKEMNISDELLSKFLEGRTDGAEDVRLLQELDAEDISLEDLAAIAEAAKLVDVEPQKTPDLTKAEDQVKAVLDSSARETMPYVTDRRRSRQRIVWATAASVAVVLAVALFFLFRPERSDNNLAQQEKERVETESKTQGQNQETTVKTEQTDKTRQNDMPSKNDAEGVQPEPTNAQPEECTTQMMEKQYAQKAQASSLTVVKPNKDNYRVLCKNLEKTLDFEWSAMNVQTLHFEVKDPKGKTVAETRDVSTRHYELKYQDIQPEKKLTWALVVVFKDGTQEKRTGQIQIDYNY